MSKIGKSIETEGSLVVMGKLAKTECAIVSLDFLFFFFFSLEFLLGVMKVFQN